MDVGSALVGFALYVTAFLLLLLDVGAVERL